MTAQTSAASVSQSDRSVPEVPAAAKAGTVDRASVTKLAEEQLQAGEYEACFLTVTLLDQAEGPKDSTLQALATICSIHRSANVQDWNKVLGVPVKASEEEVKRQYKKLAAKVHPDKCCLPRAEEAFKLLGKAVGQVMASAASARRGVDPEEEGPAAWWEAWEEDVRPINRKRQFPTSKPCAEDEKEDCALDAMTAEELQAEVRKRQAAVLRPEPGSEEELMNAFQRQKRLRIARTVLGEKLQKVNAGTGRGFH